MTRRIVTRQDGTRRVVEVSRSGRVKADWPACDSCDGTGVGTWRDDGYSDEDSYSFGDDQCLPDQSHRYTFPLADGSFVVVTHSAAVCQREDEPRFYWDERTDIVYCTDDTDPGGSETDSDVEYGEGSSSFYATPGDAHRAARRIIAADWRHALFTPPRGRAPGHSCEGTGISGPVFTREDGTTEPLVPGCALDGAMGWHNTYRVVREIACPLGYEPSPEDDAILSAYESGEDVEIRNGDGRHQWQVSRFAGNRTCSVCGLLPLDSDDDESECRTYHDSAMVGQLSSEIADEATDWLNQHTTRGFWQWDMGELHLMPSCDGDESEPCTLADPDECATHGLMTY